VWKKICPFGKWGSAWERPPGVGRGHGKGGLWGLLVLERGWFPGFRGTFRGIFWFWFITFFKEIGSSSVSIFLIN